MASWIFRRAKLLRCFVHLEYFFAHAVFVKLVSSQGAPLSIYLLLGYSVVLHLLKKALFQDADTDTGY